MNSTIKIIFISAFIFLLLGPAWCGQNEKSGRIEIEEDLFDFGFIPIDYKFIHYYRVKNVGKGNLKIDRLVPGCDCSTAHTSDTLIPPGETGIIKLLFDTKNYYGPNTRYITVHSNDPENPTVELKYKSNIGVMPKYFKIEPRSLFFLSGHKEKLLKLRNLSKDEIQYSITTDIDSIYTIDKPDGKIGRGSDISLNIAPIEKLGRGTYFSSFVVTIKADHEIKISVPVKIVRY